MSGLRAFCLLKAPPECGSVASHRWHADSLETVGAEERLWHEREPDETMPTNTVQLATDHQPNCLTVPEEALWGSYLKNKLLSRSIHAGFCC